MDGAVATLLVITLVAHASTLAIKSDGVESDSMQTSDGNMDRKLEQDSSQFLDTNELRKRYGMLLDILRKDHPFGFGLTKYQNPTSTDKFPFGSYTLGRRRDHPFGFQKKRTMMKSHPFGFGSKDSRDRYNPTLTNTHAFHGKREVDDSNGDASLDEMQTTSVFHGKRKRDENLLSQWLDDKVIQAGMRK